MQYNKQKHKIGVKCIISSLTLVIVAFLLWNYRDDLYSLQHITFTHFLIIVVLQSLKRLAQAEQLRKVLYRVTAVHIPFKKWFSMFITASLSNSLFAQSGNIYFASTLKKYESIAITHFIGGRLFVLWLNTCLTILILFVLILCFQPYIRISGFPVVILVAILLFLSLAGPGLAVVTFRIIVSDSGESSLSGMRAHVNRLVETISKCCQDAAVLGHVLFTALIIFVVGMGAFSVVFHSIGLSVGLVELAFFLALLKLSSQVIITPGNIGIRELAYGFLSQELGMGIAHGILASVIVRVSGYAVLFPFGIYFAGRELFILRGSKNK